MPYFDEIPFVHGLDLCERLFFDIVKPLLNQHFPSLQYAACRIGPGSDVLYFDTAQSRDHDWGPKLDILLPNDEHIDELNAFLTVHLREKTVCDYSTQFQPFVEENGQIVLLNAPNDEDNTRHGITIMTVQQFFTDYLNWMIDNGEPTVQDWLTFPSQNLLTIARGRIFHDSEGVGVERVRTRLAYYPRDIWLFMIGACWQRIGQEEHLMGRAGQAGDELGSSLIASRLVRDIMRLVFLLEKQYFPYPKWFGTAFCKWTIHGSYLEPILRQVQLANTWQERENHLSRAYEKLVTILNEKLSDTVKLHITPQVSQFHDRPFQVIQGGSIADAVFAQIQNESIRQLPPIGNIDLFTDSTDAISPKLRMNMKEIFK